jgi:hypothetical protein
MTQLKLIPQDLRGDIERAAQGILDARALYPTWTLAELYDPDKMPPELIEAHRRNDEAVDAAYAATARRIWGPHTQTSWRTDSERVAFLFRLYHFYTTGER